MRKVDLETLFRVLRDLLEQEPARYRTEIRRLAKEDPDVFSQYVERVRVELEQIARVEDEITYRQGKSDRPKGSYVRRHSSIASLLALGVRPPEPRAEEGARAARLRKQKR